MSGYSAETARALARWGASAEMGPLEAIMWRGEVDPRLRSTVLSVEILDRVPDWDRLVAAHEWGIRAIPRATQRVVEPPLGLGPPTWVDDDAFDLSYHLRRASLPAGGGMRALLDMARTIAQTPFDRSRPPWEMTLVEGLPDGRAAFISKMHHSTTDGLGGMQLVALGRSRQRDHTPDKVAVPPTGRHAARSPVQLLADQTVRAVRGIPGTVRRGVGDAARLAGQLVRDPLTPVEEVLRYADSLRRVAGRSPTPGSPLLAGRGTAWHFETHEVPLADLKAAAKAMDASLNDVYLAALLGALGRYHERLGVVVDAVPIAFPISLRRGDDPLGGNRFAGARLAGPLDVRDPAERIRQVRRAVLEVRAEPALAALDRLSSVLWRAPTPLLTRIMVELGQDNDLQASNVPGVPYPTYLAGAKVERLYPFGPLPGCGAMITMVSHDGTCCIGANLDTAAVTEPAVFAACLVQSFDEIVALGT